MPRPMTRLKFYLYAMFTPCQPNIVKIGVTNNIDRRRRELSRPTAVPLPYEVIHYRRCFNAEHLEHLIHHSLRGKRVNPNREFFYITHEEARMIIDFAVDTNMGVDRSNLSRSKKVGPGLWLCYWKDGNKEVLTGEDLDELGFMD